MNLKALTAECAPAKIIAVSKLQPLDKIERLFHEGQQLFGENYVQEALEKISALAHLPEIKWHFIGHLQKNKVKQIVGRFDLIHSVDSLALAKVINHQCQLKNITQNILLQINVALEDSKGGFTTNEVRSAWGELNDLRNLKIQGLMTMPPLTEADLSVCHYFGELRLLLEELRLSSRDPRELRELSMGTSQDYKLAVQEGATFVRLGTILFGERHSDR